LQIKNITLLLIVFCIGGCANDAAFLKAKSAINKGQYAAFNDLKKIVEDQPENVEYKSFYFKERELVIGRLLKNAKTEQMNQHWDEATQLYNSILEIDAVNQQATQGITSVLLSKENALRLKQATDLFNDSQDELAREKLKQILTLERENIGAKKLLEKIEQKKIDSNTPYAKVISKFKKPISLEFNDANIKAVFEVLSKSTGVNFILDKELKAGAKVSLYVKDTTIDDALKNIFSANQLSRKILNENTVLVYPNAKKSEYEDIMAKTFYLKNVEPKKAQELIKTVVKTKDIFVDDKLNILVMRDTQEAIRMAEKLINAYDLGDPEVLLEVEVLEISNNIATELGLRWPSQATMSLAGSAGKGQFSLDEIKNIKSGMVSLNIADPTLILNLKSSDGVSNLLANPHIRVKNHKKAKVHIGDRVPVVTSTSTATGFVSESVSYLDVGLKLDVEPSIMTDDEVSIEVGLEVSNIVKEVVTKSGSVSYRLGTRNAATTLRLKNGETQMLAGLISNEERTSADNVPGLASLPILGKIFSNKRQTNDRTEIVLLITPKIVRNLVMNSALDSTEFSLGTEAGSSKSGISSGFEQSNYIVQQQQTVQEDPPPLDVSLPPPQAIVPIQLNLPPPPPPLP